MIYTDKINADGVYDLNAGYPTKEIAGTVVIVNPNAAHTYTVGFYDGQDNFHTYSDGGFTADIHVKHGVGTRLAIQVSGITAGDDLVVGYAG